MLCLGAQCLLSALLAIRASASFQLFVHVTRSSLSSLLRFLRSYYSRSAFIKLDLESLLLKGIALINIILMKPVECDRKRAQFGL